MGENQMLDLTASEIIVVHDMLAFKYFVQKQGLAFV